MGALNINRIVVNSLSQNAGTITAVINGATYTVAVGSLTASNLYMVYFVPTTGLVVSTNFNSVGPAGQTSWVLVGAFVSSTASAFTQFIPITGLPILNCSVVSNTLVTINASVTGYMDMLGLVSDPFGLVTGNAGAYTSSTGVYATTNPRVTNPLPNAKVRMLGQIGWTPGNANVAGNWDISIKRNTVQVRSVGKNGQAANTAGLNWLTHRIAWLGSGQAIGDFYEILADNNNGAVPTGLDYLDIEIVGTSQLKDL